MLPARRLDRDLIRETSVIVIVLVPKLLHIKWCLSLKLFETRSSGANRKTNYFDDK